MGLRAVLPHSITCSKPLNNLKSNGSLAFTANNAVLASLFSAISFQNQQEVVQFTFGTIPSNGLVPSKVWDLLFGIMDALEC